ncbi:hypothetical protein BaRGS_00013053 [Batillaria attramentaria]|uniref:Uncharacterized protein n=1 Tax=Batillaria attramentaria TaxID=370345 RepID=A0ABD0L8L5_9CAEN
MAHKAVLPLSYSCDSGVETPASCGRGRHCGTAREVGRQGVRPLPSLQSSDNVNRAHLPTLIRAGEYIIATCHELAFFRELPARI